MTNLEGVFLIKTSRGREKPTVREKRQSHLIFTKSF